MIGTRESAIIGKYARIKREGWFFSEELFLIIEVIRRGNAVPQRTLTAEGQR